MSESTAASEPASKNAIARLYRGNRVIGAGFFVGGGYVLTCAHVVRDALGLGTEDTAAVGKEVNLDFVYPWLRKKLRKKVTAEVLLYRLNKNEEEQNEDVAGLRLLTPLPEEIQPASLLASYRPRGSYKVVGFPKGHSKGIASYGQLLEDLPNGWVQMEDTKAQGLAIQPGFSGTPVWDEATNNVVGMIVAREKDQPEAKIGFMVPARSLIAVKRELSIHSLLRLLQGHAETLAEVIGTAYRLSCPLRKEIPETLAEKLSNLQNAKQGKSSFEAMDRFVALLSLPELNPDESLSEELKQWLEGRVEDLSALLDEVQSLLPKFVEGDAADITSHLLIYVKDESSESRSVSALFVRDGSVYDKKFGAGSKPVQAPEKEPFEEKVTLDNLPSLVQACLKEVMAQSPSNLVLHLILPTAWLSQGCDRWSVLDRSKLPLPIPDVRIGVRFCCIVRITERLNPDFLNMFREPWQQKWAKLLSMTSNDICTAFVQGDGLSLDTELFEQLSRPTNVGLKLSTVYGDNQYMQLFGTLIATGTPAAVWLRHDQFAEGICVTTDLNQLLTCKIAKLPEKVKHARTTAIAKPDNGHIGHHLSFLWEDPDLIPPSTQMSLGMPQS